MKISLLFLIACISFGSIAQERATISGTREYKKKRKAVAAEAIESLKDGILLVRLNMKNREVEYYEKYGNFKEASRIREKQEKENNAIKEAFSSQYHFSHVYYFAMSDSRHLINGQLDSVEIVNSEGLPVDIKDSSYFIGEFGILEADTTYYYSGKTPSTNNQENPEGKAYYGGQRNQISALLIRDAEFIQLQDPFPYGRYYPMGTLKNRYREAVEKLQNRLDKFYKSNKENYEKNQ